MNLTYFGHACFSVEINGKNILFDPFISENELAKDIDISSVKADYILISHGHFDHIKDVEEIAGNTGAQLVSNFEIISWFGNKGIENGHPMNHGGQWNFDFGTAKFVNAVHSSVMPDGAYGGNPGGFIVRSSQGNFYYAGDTALHADMSMYGQYEKLDFAVLPIGDNFTMGVDDALIAADMINCDKIVGVHYDTFGYIEIDKEEAKRKFSEKGKELILIEIGDTVKL